MVRIARKNCIEHQLCCNHQTPYRTINQRISVSILYVALVCLTPIVSAIPFVPGILLLMQFSPWREFWIYLSLLPVVGASFVFLLTTQVAILKWILVGKVKPGIYPVHGGFYIRN